MKLNYNKIEKKAIKPLNQYNLQELLIAFVYDGKLPITKDHIHGKDQTKYKRWCNFGDKINRFQKELGEKFAIALDPSISEGCIYGDIDILKKLGYEEITLTEALEELPNMSTILGVTPNQTLEEQGLLPDSPFAPHHITLDGVIRANNSGCLASEEVIDLLTIAGYISESHNKLYDLFELTDNDYFTLKGYTYDEFASSDNLRELTEACKSNTGLIYDLINNPEIIQVIHNLDSNPVKKYPKCTDL
ncbi:MAG: hypothetical protein K2G03_05385 [Bacilli bacterium]|nr:hypothetical protein [Bacilli bacterium]